MEEYKFLVEQLKSYLNKEKAKILEALVSDLDEVTTKGLRYQYNSINELEKFLMAKITEVKKWED